NGVQIRCGDSSNASLTVNGGSLTATGSGATFAGIIMQFGSSTSGSGTPTVTVSDNAIVRANGSAGGITSNSSAEVQTAAGTGESGGIVFDNGTGTVYGDVELQEDITIGEGESLTIPQGASLDTNGKLTVNGGTLNGTPSGSVTYKVTGVSLSLNTLILDVGDEGTLTATITPDNASNKSINWESSDTGVATVDANGKVTAVSVGSTAITATAADGSGKSATCSVTVNAKPTYTISADVTPSVAGTATADKITAAAGAIVTLTATANPGYRFTGWTSSNEGVTFDDPSSVSTTFTMPAGDVAVTAQFEKLYTVTISPAEGGTATADKSTAAAGETVTLTTTPESGYYFVEWKVVPDNLSIQENQFTMPAENVEVQAVFGLSVTNITLDKTELSLYTGDSETLTATIEPDNATNQAVTWESSDPNVATVDNGKVTAVAAGEAIITVTTADGGKTATCQVKVTQSTYSITADITTLDFGSVYIGYTRPTAQTVTITNTGNRPQTLDQPTSTTNFVVGTLSKMELAAGEGATFTVQPKAGLAVGTYSENITVSSSEGATVTIPTSFTVLGVTNIIINKSELILYIGDNETLTATIEPIEAAGQTVTWKSSNETIATVDANGKVTAVYAGEATITATVGDKTAICEVKVRKPAEVGSTSSTNLSLTTDRDEFALTAIVYGENLDRDKAKWTWSVADADVVALSGLPTWRSHSYSINRQTFTIKGTGTTTITATYDDGIYRGSVDFTVRISKPTPPDPISYYNIYVEDVCDGVEVTLSNNVVREGNSISVYVKKDTANYTFDNFHVYYKEGYYDSWDELKEGTQPGEYPIKNIWTHIYIKALGAEEKEDPTGIESIEGVKVYTKDGSLYVQTPQREQVIIVSMSGAVVKNEEQVGLKQYHGLQPGIYIVRVGDRAYKLRLN
ncbi:MAG: Ig-like domain-containing protein, partial [Parabacteroides sp.]|nr:Ig-like domain-containing protein [Parabacteroides sp.]MDY5623434.1 Ig-like domain-containing protein [Bacteroidales bacterium]MDY6254460.1 Ig-like domain-containing protein [Bacteroidales bacterium]